ncbi:MAG: GAF domain-containing sensor histidine kinase [Candidatus Thermoplasmatota archaeon]|nr:GAF domain-containing sensor histidine kinase [Candidatus Thermoplasmatota archaeon]
MRGIRRRIWNYLQFWYPPVIATAVPTGIVILMAAFGVSLGSSSMDVGVDLASVVYLIIMTSAICTAYLLRYKELELRYDLISAAAFLQFLLISTAISVYFSDAASDIVFPIIGLATIIVLAAGIPLSDRREKWPTNLMFLWLSAPTVMTLAFLYSLHNMSTGVFTFMSNNVVDTLAHVVVISIALIIILKLRHHAFKPFRYSFHGLIAFSFLLIFSTMIHFMSTRKLDLAWWVSSLLVWLSLLFVLWGNFMDYTWYTEEEKHTYQLMNQVQNSLRRETPARLSAGIAIAISSGIKDAGCFSYTSMDGEDWELEDEVVPSGMQAGSMPPRLNFGVRELMLDEPDVFISSSDRTAAGRRLKEVSAVPCGGAIFRAPNGRFHFLGIREAGRQWWEGYEIIMLKSIALALGLAAYQRETSVKRAKMIMQLLSITHAVKRIFSASDLAELRSNAIRLITDELGFDNVSLWSVEENDILVPRNFLWRGRKEKELSSNDVLRFGVGIVGTVARTGKPLLANDVTAEPAYVDLIGSDTQSEYAVPVMQDDRVIAVLDVQSNQKNSFDSMDTEVIDTIAMLIAAGFDFYRLRSDLNEGKKLAEMRAGLVSHDLRNMFQAMRVFLQLLRSDLSANKNVPARDLDYIKNIESSIDASLKFLENVLKIFKIESGTLELTSFDLREVLENSASIVKLSFPSRDIRFMFSLDTSPTVLVGNSLIGEVFSNLFSNSAKYCDKAQVVVEVTAQKCSRKGRETVCVRVTDNGRGIPRNRFATVFNRFHTATGGTGLGLSLVKEIMDSIGAEIELVENVPGDSNGGTSFILYFIPFS